MGYLLLVGGILALVVGTVTWRFRETASRVNLEMKRGVYPHMTEGASSASTAALAIGLMVGGAGSILVGLLDLLS